MEAPFFSIVLPTYNRSKLLPRAVRSVQEQTFADWELIIVDDGSTDDTGAVVSQFQDDRIRYHFQENMGRGGVRNTGIQEAQGQYIAFLDDDDYYLPDHLLCLYDVLEEKGFPIGVVRTEGFWERRSGKLQPLRVCPPTFERAFLYHWREGATPMFFVFHQKVLEKIRFNPEFTFSEDLHVVLRAIWHFPNFFTQQRSVVLCDHATRSSYQSTPDLARKALASRLGVTHDLLNQFGEKIQRLVPSSYIAERIAHDYLFAADKAARSGCWKDTIRFLGNAIQSYFTWVVFKKSIRISSRLVLHYLKR